MKCANCNKHKGTEVYLGEGSIMDYVHGNYSMWCKCCVLKAQIKYCKEAMKRIKKLEKHFKKVICN
jgi:hypothetical protein